MREPRWKALKKCTKKNTVASAPVTELELEVLGLVGQRHDENDSAGLCLSLSLSLSLYLPQIACSRVNRPSVDVCRRVRLSGVGCRV